MGQVHDASGVRTGSIAVKRFAKGPHTDGSVDYMNFLHEIEAKNKEIRQGATTVRPGG
jgi:hypothetical protein